MMVSPGEGVRGTEDDPTEGVETVLGGSRWGALSSVALCDPRAKSVFPLGEHDLQPVEEPARKPGATEGSARYVEVGGRGGKDREAGLDAAEGGAPTPSGAERLRVPTDGWNSPPDRRAVYAALNACEGQSHE